MDYFQRAMNQEIGRKMQTAREKKGWTQNAVRMELQALYEKELKQCVAKSSIQISEKEIEDYFDYKFEKLDKSLQDKLKKFGITESYRPIAISTISNYENGTKTIPAYHLEAMKKILGDI